MNKISFTKSILCILFLVYSNSTIGQQYDLYLNYSFRGTGNYPRVAEVQIQTRNTDGGGRNTLYWDEGEVTYNESFDIRDVVGVTTNSPRQTINGIMDVDILGSPTGDAESEMLDENRTSGGFVLRGDFTTFSANLTIRKRIVIENTLGDALCYKDKTTINATPGHPSKTYRWGYRIPKYELKFNILPERTSTISVSLIDLYPVKYLDYIDEIIEFKIFNDVNNYETNPVTLAWKDCSIALVGNPLTTNANCNGSNDGKVTLNFKEDVEPGYEMRYYIYEGDPSSFPSGEETNPNPDNPLAFPQTVDNVRFSDGPSPNQVGSLKSNNDGTFRGQSKESLGEGTYYVLYQEVRYNYPNEGDVDVKSGELIPDSFTIDEPSPIVASATITQAQCNENTAQINFSASGGNDLDASGNYSYQYQLNGDGNWITASANPQNVPLTSSDQTVQTKAVYSVGNCESEEITLLDKIEAIVSPLILTNPSPGIVSSSSTADGVISINYDGGTPNYTFQLAKQNEVSSTFDPVLNPTIIDNPFSKRVEFRNLDIGTYRITINDKGGSGCSLTTESLGDIVVGTAPLPILGAEEIIPISCSYASNGSILVNISGGVAPYNYEWTINGNTSPIQTTDDTSISLNNLSETGEYILKVASNGFTDFNDTAGYVATTINLAAPEQVSIDNTTITNISCNGAQDGSILVAVSGGTNYEYKLDAFDDWQVLNGNIITITSGGVHDLYLRNSENGCEAVPIIDALIVEEPDTIDVQMTLNNVTTNDGFDGGLSLVIDGGTPFATALTAYGINWTKEKDGNVTSFVDTDLSSPYDITNLEAAIYGVTITDANGCVFSQSFEITEPGELAATLAQSVFLECNGDDFAEITANVQGGVIPYTFEWFETVNGSDDLLSEDTHIIANLAAGDFFLRVTDANNVIADSNTITVREPESLLIQLDGTTDVLCIGETTGAIEISVVGGTAPYSYSWSNGASTQDLLNVAAGDYNLNVVDANGCFAEIDVAVNAAPDAIRIEDSTVTDVSAYLANDGSISLGIGGGATPYTINWVRVSDNAIMGNGNIIANLSADSYQVTISDANGCIIGETYEVIQPDIVVETIEQPTCGGDANGSIAVLVNQGNGTFSYEWNTGAITNSISGLASGSYTVTISGFGDGPITRTYVLEDPEPISVDLGLDRTLCAGQDLVLNATVADETAVYTWTSDRGFSSNSPQVTIAETGNYTVSVATANGCTAQGAIFVDSSLDEINAEFAVSSQVFVNENFVAVDISYPLPDGLEWVLPEEATVLKKDNDEVELRFDVVGEYEIEIITTKGNCIAQKTKKIIVVPSDEVLAKEGSENGKKQIVDFVIHPNPTNGKFTAQVGLSDEGSISIKIFNFANNALVAYEKDGGKELYTVPFDISGVPSGVYVVLLETPYGNTVRKIVVK